jgi:uncharacterized lipoprotein YddW (UPF0748 family)
MTAAARGRSRWRPAVLVLLGLLASTAAGARLASAQTDPPVPQYRGFWVDTFNTRFATPDDVAAIVARATLAGTNLVVVQVRRRGDAWYLDGREPLAEGVAFPADFDPLRELIARAHAAGLAVHAAVTVGAIWNQAVPPQHPDHVFNRHGFDANGPLPGRQNWLTRTRPGDPIPAAALGGYRFGLDFWIDPGHPDAAAYTVDVVTDLVRRYPIDGLHLDALRYPEVPPAATDEWSPSVGYNDVSLERYRRLAGLPADALPAASDEAWGAWRREQVTALLRRLTLAALAVRPAIVVSAGLAATGDAPAATAATDDEAWRATESYGRVFQDWYHWSEAQLVDLLIPLVYRAEHVTTAADAFAAWVQWTRAHAAGRHVAIAVGAYLNSIEGSLRQARRATAAALASNADPPATPAADGVLFFALGAHNAPVSGNPLAVSGPRDTPYRSFDDLAAGLLTGRTTAGQLLESASLPPLFHRPASLPLPAWKTAPLTGHLRGTLVSSATNQPIDGAALTLEPEATVERRGVGGIVDPQAASVALDRTDGGGAFGALGLASGRYRVIVTPPRDGRYRSTCVVTIAPGTVATMALELDPSRPAIATCDQP